MRTTAGSRPENRGTLTLFGRDAVVAVVAVAAVACGLYAQTRCRGGKGLSRLAGISIDMRLTAAVKLSSRLVLSLYLSPFFHRDHQCSNHPPWQSLGASAVNLTAQIHITYALGGVCKRYLRSLFLFMDRALLARHINLIRRWSAHPDAIAGEAVPELSEGQSDDTVPSPSSVRYWIGPQPLAIEVGEYAFF